MKDVLIGLGGNLGDVEATFGRACRLLESDLRFIRMSRVYWTEPVYDKPGAVIPVGDVPWYRNAVIRAETSVPPHDLLLRLLDVEHALGRQRPSPECSPRPIDLDLLLYGDDVITPEKPGDLEIPHPRMHLRTFVLQPAVEVAPDWMHPVLHKSLRELYRMLPSSKGSSNPRGCIQSADYRV